MKSVFLVDGSDQHRLPADAGAYSIVGTDARLGYAAIPERLLSADGAGYVLAFEAAAGGKGFVCAVGAGRYAIAGQPAGSRRGYVLTAAAGVFTMAGTDAVLVHRDAPGSRPIVRIARRTVISIPRQAVRPVVAARRIYRVEAA